MTTDGNVGTDNNDSCCADTPESGGDASAVETGVVHTGDTFDVVPNLPPDSVHAIVCDPPYGLNFMYRDWDDFRRRRNEADVGRENVMGRMSARAPASGAETDMRNYQHWCEQWATAVKRVLKPGGHLLAFSGNRTHHRLFSGVEDAGFEVRDTITWHFAEGFPKGLDVSKAIDDKFDADRKRTGPGPNTCEYLNRGEPCPGHGEETSQNVATYHTAESEPATSEAEHWDGWKTQLKPATEFVVVARKPLSEGTVAENVLEHGTGALNIDGCRIGTADRYNPKTESNGDCYGDTTTGENVGKHVTGRYPPNVVYDGAVAERLDADHDDTESHLGERGPAFEGNVYGAESGESRVRGYEDSGGPSRYFKVHEWDEFARRVNGALRFKYTSKASTAERTLDGTIANSHPTVKPVDLMDWLVTLVTNDDQIVLDPFAGTGTTLAAAKAAGRQWIGIEQDAKWADVARVRCGLEANDYSHIHGDDDADETQTALSELLAGDGTLGETGESDD